MTGAGGPFDVPGRFEDRARQRLAAWREGASRS
jgi:hypothetical protein